MSVRFRVAVALIAVALPAAAQHAASPYSGQQSRDIKALSDDEVKSLLTGAGMGLAKSAELNRYPGPMHVLEHREALKLSPGQRASLESLMQRHKDEARSLGARVVELERELDGVFAGGQAAAAAIDRILAQLGETTARLRGSHLKTHLETRALLTPAQVDRYVELRGYGGGDAHRHRH